MLAEPRPDILDDRYEIGTLIGRGGMGDVHRAVDHRLGREVAVKFLRGDLAAQPSVRDRFEEEARSAARLTHPNVVLVLDSGEHERCPYLVMECLPGPSLYDEMVRGPLDPDRVRSIGLDVLAGLGAAHELGIVHRDVKPANILLTDDGRAKLADFGIAKSTEGLDHTMVGQVLGTPAYLAPERLAGKPATPSADLYALGVVLYEALCGEPPFVGDTPLAVAHAVATTQPVPLAERSPGLDPRLSEAIDHAMVKDPTQRVQTAAEMVAYLEGQGASAATQLVPAATNVIDGAEPTRVVDVAETATVAEPSRAARGTGGASSARTWWATRPRELRMLMVAAVALALVLFTISAAGRDGPQTAAPQAPTPSVQSAPTGSIPPPLADAIDRLEKAVKR